MQTNCFVCPSLCFQVESTKLSTTVCFCTPDSMSHKSLDSKFVCVSLAHVSLSQLLAYISTSMSAHPLNSLYICIRMCMWVLAMGHGAHVPGGDLNPHLPWTCQPRSTSAVGSTGSGCVWPCWSGSSCRGGRCTPCSSEYCDGRNPTTHIQDRKQVSWRLDQTWWLETSNENVV